LKHSCKILFTILLLSFNSLCSADEIRLKFVNSPLSEIITQIRDDRSLSVSFDSGELSKYKVTIDTVFLDSWKAITFLLKDLPFRVSTIEGVIVISPLDALTSVSGIIIDSESGESLPFANIILDKKVLISDANGMFRISAASKNPIKFSVRYLGYKFLDTVLVAGADNYIKLKAVHIELKEVFVRDIETGQALQVGEQPGLIRINHQIAQYLPGNGDNSVFNLLRMMPGIRASGEPSELSVWGSKPGESAVLFDGFRLFSMNGFNEQISSINPTMVKDIRLLKGGYNSSYGNQTGAIADITGIDGRRGHPTLILNINNLTTNLFASTPLGKNTALSAAYRQTYYGLYDVNKLNPFGKNNNETINSNLVDLDDSLFVVPNYVFRDLNIKLSGKASKSDRYFISLYGASDNFKYNLTGEEVDIDAFERNIQFAGGSGYSKIWKGGAVSNILLKYSLLKNNSVKAAKISDEDFYSFSTDNLIEEVGAKASHSILLFGSNDLDAGLGFETYKDVSKSVVSSDSKVNFYVNDMLNFRRLQMNIGARTDLFKDKLYIQPRISIKYTLLNNLSTSFSWGIYNQFIGKVPILYENDISSIIWKVLGSNEYPVIGATHTILNLSYYNTHWLVSLEGYNKTTWGLTSLYHSNRRNNVVEGESATSGIDFFTKWENKGSQVFTSVSVAKSKDSYLMDVKKDLYFTPIEVKIGGLWNMYPFFLSAEYVYAEGFSEQYGTGRYSNYVGGTYNRLDVAATFSFKIKGANCKTGLSIINLLNTSNVKTLDVLPTPAVGTLTGIVNLFSESVPFTPTLFLAIAL